MELKEIRQIVEMMKRHELSLFHLEKKDFKIMLKKGPDMDQVLEAMKSMPVAPQMVQAPMAAVAPAAAAPVAAGPAVADAPEAVDDGTIDITAPTVGTFYLSPSPEAPAFAQVGDKIGADTTVCIIEAMKVMNEIKAEVSGTITEVVAKDATAIQYGEVLFKVKPD